MGHARVRRSGGLARRSLLSAALAVLASLILATGALAAPPTWSAPITVRNTSDPTLGDADFQRRNVAVTWDEPNAPREVGIRTSVDSGAAFGPISWFEGARHPALEVCGSEVHAVMEMAAPGTWLIQYAAGSIDGDGYDTTTVSPSTEDQIDPDVACTRGRVFVAWTEEDFDGYSLWLSHALRAGGPFSEPEFLSFHFDNVFNALAVAGVDNRAYAVFQGFDGELQFARWSVGSGPGFAVTLLDEQEIGPGRPNNPAFNAVIAAAGDKVAVAWTRCGGMFARVSNDRGATWGPVHRLLDHAACGGDFFTAPSSIAIRGNEIALTYDGAGIPNVSFSSLIRTTNDFASFTDDTIAEGHVQHMVGYVRSGGEWRLADVFWTRGGRIRFRSEN